jgi:hypothetical protein
MQKLWEGAREAWESTLREEGRRTLKGTEERVRFIIKNGGKEYVEDESVAERRAAREAVAKVREALARMNGSDGKENV